MIVEVVEGALIEATGKGTGIEAVSVDTVAAWDPDGARDCTPAAVVTLASDSRWRMKSAKAWATKLLKSGG